MNRLTTLLAVVLGAGSLAFGQATTMPADLLPTKVLVIPFAQIGNTTGHEWVGAALQESLMNEAEGNTEIQPIALNRPLARGDMPQVTVAAKGTGAALVVFGAYQYSDSQLRVTGEVVDVNAGRVIGTLKATGALVDLFKIEDSLTGQLEAALPQPPRDVPVANATAQPPVPIYTGEQPATVAAPTTTYVYQAPPADYSPNYVYSYPDYGYGYPYYYYGGFPIIINGGWGWGPHYYPHGFVGGFHGGFHGGFVGGFHGGPGFHPGFVSGGFHGGGIGPHGH